MLGVYEFQHVALAANVFEALLTLNERAPLQGDGSHAAGGIGGAHAVSSVSSMSNAEICMQATAARRSTLTRSFSA